MEAARLEFIITAVNRAREAMQQVQAGYAAMGQAAQTFNERARTAAERARQAFRTLQEFVRGLPAQFRAAFDRAANAVRPAIQAIGAAVQRMAQSVRASLATLAPALAGLGQRASGSLSGLGGNLSGLAQGGLAAGFGAIAAGMGAIAKTGVDMNLTLEGSAAALTRMTGSSGTAAKLIADLREEALYSMSTFKDLLPMAQSLVSVFQGAFGPRGVGLVVPTIRAFGDAAVSLRVDAEGMERALYGFRQLVGRPFAQQEEINQVLENLPGANIRQYLTQAFGTADTELLQKAGRTGAEVGLAIVQGLQRAFGGAQKAGAGTIPMLQSSISDTFNDLSASVTQGLGARWQTTLRNAADLLARFTTTAAGANVIRQLTQAMNAIGNMSIALGALMARLAQSPVLVEAMLTPFQALGNVAKSLWMNVGAVTQALEKLFNGPAVKKTIAAILATAVTLAERLLKLLGVDLKATLDNAGFEGLFQAFGEAIGNLVTSFFGIGRVAKEIATMVESGFRWLGNQISDTFTDVFNGIKIGFLGMTAEANRAIGNIIDTMARMGDAVNASPFMRRLGFTVDTNALRAAAGVATDKADSADRTIGNMKDWERYDKMLRESRDLYLKLFYDPAFGMDPGERIGNAFLGKQPSAAGYTDGEDRFRQDLFDNYKRIYGFLFGEEAPAGGAGGESGAGVPGVRRGSSSVAPSFATPGFPDQGYFEPVFVPGRGMISRGVAIQQGLIAPPAAPSPTQPDDYSGGYADPSGSYVPPSASTIGGDAFPMHPGPTRGGGQYVFAPNVNAAPSADELRRVFYGMVDEFVRQAFPQGSGY